MKAEKIVITGSDAPLRRVGAAIAANIIGNAGLAVFKVCSDSVASQKEMEKVAESAAALCEKNCIILCEGGYADHLSKDGSVEISPICARDGYGAVFFLAEGDLTAEETLHLSRWVGTPHLRVVDKASLSGELYSFLGIPRPLEIERKFLIERPDTEALSKSPLCRRVHICQTYLKITADEEIRVRRRGEEDDFLYFETVKRAASKTVREEIESRIDKSRYEELLKKAPEDCLSIEKDRYCLIHNGQYFEIDVYPFSEELAVAELELCSEDEEIHFPPEIKIIREVTGEKAYKNATLAKEKNLR